ncbi:unnamed protein product [Caenorhabditis angaria]|uniref:Protein kinase domain-containing protein n=1 Tax=Caenorhabditis angaria TaxID=860376 RepID=A0A9P1IC67_9PELO|nr:unnamed protein product [Caenorhabditis angaria]
MADNNNNDINQTEEQLVFNVGDSVTGYTIIEKIDEGGYGQVFKVSKDDKIFAMKIESNSQEGGSAIKLEIEVLKDLRAKKMPNFPLVVRAGRKIKYHFLIMELLGENLRTLKFRSSNPDCLSVGTWTRLGIQCLYTIKLMHDCGYLHRDIKPSNFALGPSDDLLKKRLIYLFDFGLARKFVVKARDERAAAMTMTTVTQQSVMGTVEEKLENIKSSDYRWRLARRRTDFRGTQMYASPNAHDLKELGRADDVWSLMFMLAEFIAPLPWANEDKELANVKKSSKLSEMFKSEAFDKLEENLKSCDYYTPPDYEIAYNLMKSLLEKSGTNWNDPYDWEMKDQPEIEYRKWKDEKTSKNVVYVWENPKEFFKLDIWLNVPKPGSVKQKLKKNASVEQISGQQTSEGRKKNEENLEATKTIGEEGKSVEGKKKSALSKRKTPSIVMDFDDNATNCTTTMCAGPATVLPTAPLRPIAPSPRRKGKTSRKKKESSVRNKLKNLIRKK